MVSCVLCVCMRRERSELQTVSRILAAIMLARECADRRNKRHIYYMHTDSIWDESGTTFTAVAGARLAGVCVSC